MTVIEDKHHNYVCKLSLRHFYGLCCKCYLFYPIEYTYTGFMYVNYVSAIFMVYLVNVTDF